MYKPTSVEDYFSTITGVAKDILQDLRERVQKLVPEAEELITYGMPGFKYKGKGLVAYSAFKNHYSYFPMSGSVLVQFKDELKNNFTGKGTLQFKYNEKISDKLLKDLINARIREIESKV
jgi:uncharacterized protein YdhG (YjbR/CyaY superfamily)